MRVLEKAKEEDVVVRPRNEVEFEVGLGDEWNAWVDKVDEIVNRQGGMFGMETVRTWENALDTFADAKDFEGATLMKGVRDKW